MLLAFLALSYYFIFKSFLSLEEKKIDNDITLADNAIQQEIDGLGAVNGDWAPWTDTQEFVLGNNKEYIENNLDASTLANLRVNSMLFFNSNKKLIYGLTIDIKNAEESSLPPAILDYINKNNLFIDSNDKYTPAEGMAVVNGLPLFLSSYPITDSSGEGEVGGRLIMLRYFDNFEQEYLASLLNHNFELFTETKAFPAEIKQKLFNQDRAILPMSENKIASYWSIKDLSDNPALFIRQISDREIYLNGRDSIFYFFIALLALSAAFGIAIVFLINKIILSRIFFLGQELKKISENKNFAGRVSLNNKDEITLLQKNINKALEALEEAVVKSKKSEKELSERSIELEKSKTELENTLEDFYTMRMGMQEQLEKGTIEEENKKIKKRLDELKGA